MAPRSENWFDFLIIGSGTAGSVLAARLSEDASLKIGLLEAGQAADNPMIAQPSQWSLLQGSKVDWGYETVPQRHTAGRVHAWPRGKVIGGSTAINAMAHVRGHPSDFDAWAEAGCKGWSFADLFPYFLKSETYAPGASAYHGDRGPVHLIRPSEPHPVTLAYMEAGNEIGLSPTDDHNGAELSGPCLNTLTIKNGKRQTIADAYLAPVSGRPNLRVLLRHRVLSLIVEKGRCRGLRAISNGGPVELCAETVILSAGAVGSPLLLLCSGIGPAEELEALGIPVAADLRGVGRNLHDHLLSGGNVYRAKRPVPPSKYQNSESLMYIGRKASASAPEMVLACVTAPVVTEQFIAPAFGDAYTIMFGFTHPRSRGSIRLASADPVIPPLIDPNYLSESYDREIYLEAMKMARAVGGASALSEWRREEALPGSSVRSKAEKIEFLEKAAFTHHHPVGTCRMGTGDDAVTGPDCKLKAIDGLYVCDASIMPRITTGPVNAAIVAMAERCSDLLQGKAPLPPERPDSVHRLEAVA
jgi:choline dehydrogenase-like flavoprotein